LRLYATIGEVFRTENIALLDPLLAPDMVDHSGPSGSVIGREPGKQLIGTYARAFPDTSLTVDLMVAEADTVAAFVSYQGTHAGLFMGYAPTGKPERVTGMCVTATDMSYPCIECSMPAASASRARRASDWGYPSKPVI
jgi:hypothetical protein